ncbi:hypothetical protein ElyMa_001026800, partial [Elysia marginata]
LSETTELNSQKILGLRKLWKLKPRTSQVTTATTSSASSLASASATATSPGPIQSLSQRSSFSVKADSDVDDPFIFDVKLLPGGLVLVADWSNECVKLFNSQNKEIEDMLKHLNAIIRLSLKEENYRDKQGGLTDGRKPLSFKISDESILRTGPPECPPEVEGVNKINRNSETFSMCQEVTINATTDTTPTSAIIPFQAEDSEKKSEDDRGGF